MKIEISKYPDVVLIVPLEYYFNHFSSLLFMLFYWALETTEEEWSLYYTDVVKANL